MEKQSDLMAFDNRVVALRDEQYARILVLIGAYKLDSNFFYGDHVSIKTEQGERFYVILLHSIN